MRPWALGGELDYQSAGLDLADLAALREALMLTVDRNTSKDAFYGGHGTPRQAGPAAASPYYSEATARSHAAYDPGRAADLLDAAGYGLRDAEGYRLHPDGERRRLAIIGPHEAGTAGGHAAQRLASGLQAVGIARTYEGLTPAAVGAAYSPTGTQGRAAGTARRLAFWATFG